MRFDPGSTEPDEAHEECHGVVEQDGGLLVVSTLDDSVVGSYPASGWYSFEVVNEP